MKEMKYLSIDDENMSKTNILHEDTYKGYKYYIVSYGSHPCAYVAIPNGHRLCDKQIDTELYAIICHGGITWANRFEDGRFGGDFVIGWDYSHISDYSSFHTGCYSDKRWSTSEMIDDAQYVIDQLVENDEKENNGQTIS